MSFLRQKETNYNANRIHNSTITMRSQQPASLLGMGRSPARSYPIHISHTYVFDPTYPISIQIPILFQSDLWGQIYLTLKTLTPTDPLLGLSAWFFALPPKDKVLTFHFSLFFTINDTKHSLFHNTLFFWANHSKLAFLEASHVVG